MHLRNGLRLQPGPPTARATREAGEEAGGAAEVGPMRVPTSVRGPMKRPAWVSRRAPRKGSCSGSPRWAVKSSRRGTVKKSMKRT